jgi:hypothetical protein
LLRPEATLLTEQEPEAVLVGLAFQVTVVGLLSTISVWLLEAVTAGQTQTESFKPINLLATLQPVKVLPVVLSAVPVAVVLDRAVWAFRAAEAVVVRVLGTPGLLLTVKPAAD